MASVADNQAAWLTEARGKIVVSPGPNQSSPADDEVIIKVSYVAINPVDWKVQDYEILPIRYPTVLGSDVAGEVVLTGSNVTRFKKGDRVIGYTLGLGYGGARHGSFQNYAACRERVVSKVPAALDLSRAVVLPLAVSTVISGFYEHLKLRHPVTGGQTPVKAGTVLIWGASSSVGSAAVQLASLAGYEVIATASPKNFDFAKKLGATEMFDYNDPDVVEKICKRMMGTNVAGVFDSIAENGSVQASAQILSKLGGGKLSITLPPIPDGLPENVEVETSTTDDYVAPEVWRDFVPTALANGSLRAKPDPIFVDGGLSGIQEAMKLQKKGVSAAKIVVKIA